jgi:hypothetical protein
MAWPTTPASTATTDADTDKISVARADINQTISNVNDIIGMFNIPATPSDNNILVYDSATGKFEVEASSSGGSEANDLTQAVVWANVPDANITQSSVVQHQAALTITESQISDLGDYVSATTGLEDAMILKDSAGAPTNTFRFTNDDGDPVFGFFIQNGDTSNWDAYIKVQPGSSSNNPSVNAPSFTAENGNFIDFEADTAVRFSNLIQLNPLATSSITSQTPPGYNTASTAAGFMAYDSTQGCLAVYDGTNWKKITFDGNL